MTSHTYPSHSVGDVWSIPIYMLDDIEFIKLSDLPQDVLSKFSVWMCGRDVGMIVDGLPDMIEYDAFYMYMHPDEN